MSLTITLGETISAQLISKFGIAFIFMFTLLLFPMSIPTSSAASQTVSLSFESNEIDGSGIINTPNHNSSSALPNMPFVGHSAIPLPIGRLCEHDSDCANFSVCRLVVSDKEFTKKICECDNQQMKLLNKSCYIKPGHQCYFPKKNSHGYTFIPCFPGSVCKKSVNKTEPGSGYCMCKIPDVADHYRNVNADYEMARCTASLLASHPLGFFLFETLMISAHICIRILQS